MNQAVKFYDPNLAKSVTKTGQAVLKQMTQHKMNQSVKKLWVEHLRSDWYEQNFEVDPTGGIQLRTTDNKWSVFGILCNIHAQTFPDVAIQQDDSDVYMDYCYVIPYEVSLWAGMRKIVGDYNCRIDFDQPVTIQGETFYDLESMSLAGIPFYMIADIIEEKL